MKMIQGTTIAVPYLNIRRNPAASSPKIYQIPPGEKVVVRRVENGWGFANYINRKQETIAGWVYMLWVRINNFTDVPPPSARRSDVFEVSDVGKYYRFRHDYERMGKPRSRIAIPETVPVTAIGSKDDFVPLTKEWQEFWFGLLVRSAEGSMTHDELLEAWTSLTINRRALTDRHSVENGFADHILGINTSAPPMAIKTLAMGGNICKSKSGYVMETLNGSQPPPKIDDVWGKHHLILWATELTCNKLPNKTYQVGRFPQLNGIYGVPYPFVSPNGAVRVNAGSVEKIKNGALWSPYNPSSA